MSKIEADVRRVVINLACGRNSKENNYIVRFSCSVAMVTQVSAY